ncbi:helix-turn-helix domain-containing protein [Arthrobacter sp. HLT1-20]
MPRYGNYETAFERTLGVWLHTQHQKLAAEPLCRELQIPEQTFYQWRVKHLGPKAHRIGRHLRISRTDFNDWIASTEGHFA